MNRTVMLSNMIVLIANCACAVGDGLGLGGDAGPSWRFAGVRSDRPVSGGSAPTRCAVLSRGSASKCASRSITLSRPRSKTPRWSRG